MEPGTTARLCDVTCLRAGLPESELRGSGDIWETVLEGSQGRKWEVQLSQVSMSIENRVPGEGVGAHWDD